MTASNHLAAGAVIATVVSNPLVAVPLAFISHFAMDAMPHYGDSSKRSWFNRHFQYVLIADLVTSLVLLSYILYLAPQNIILLTICAAVAVVPDVLWLPYYLADRKQKNREYSRVAKFLKWIQWGERPWGIIIEVVVFILLVHTLVGQIG